MDEYKIKMELNLDEDTVVVEPDEAPLWEPPRSGSKRTLAKYLKRKFGIYPKVDSTTEYKQDEVTSKIPCLSSPSVQPTMTYSQSDESSLLARSYPIDDDLTDENTNSSNSTDKLSETQFDNVLKSQSPISKAIYSSFLGPIKCINTTPFNSDKSFMHNENSVNRMLKFVLENKKPLTNTIQELTNNGWNYNIPLSKFEPLQPETISSTLSESIDKQEREIAYNLLLRKLIDESLDRNMIYSHQPKDVLGRINSLLTRQFPEYEPTRHPVKVRSYLKACRRNSKKNNGKIIMKNTAAYLSSGPGHRLMAKICQIERDTIELIKKEAQQSRTGCTTVKSLITTTTESVNGKSKIYLPPVTTTSNHLIIQSKCLTPNATSIPIIIPNTNNTVQNQSQRNSTTPISVSNNLLASRPTHTINVTKLPILLPSTTPTNTASVAPTPICTTGTTTHTSTEFKQFPLNWSQEINKAILESVQQISDLSTNQNSIKNISSQLKQTAQILINIANILDHNSNE